MAVGYNGFLVDEATRVDPAESIQFGKMVPVGLGKRESVGIYRRRKEDTGLVRRCRSFWSLARCR